ncbi:MAG TPA: HAD-IC family P-type ATPase, partial [Polyangiaceae bacterium]
MNAPAAKTTAAVHAEPIEELLSRLGADASKGLSDAEVRARIARDGKNELPTPPKPSALKQFFAQFANPIVGTLLVAAIIAIVDGVRNSEAGFLVRFGDATAIMLIVALNAVLGYYQERRAEAALDALQKMQTPNARVRRDDKIQVISAIELVVGDVLEVEAGDAVPADARLLVTANVAAEESALTGESVPVGKEANSIVPEDAPLGDRSTMLWLGTSVVRGRARAVVAATGPRTELGKLSTLIQSARLEQTP